MFERILAWVMSLLKALFVTKLPEPELVVEEKAKPVINPLEPGDETLTIIDEIVAFQDKSLALSKDAFDTVLYKSISTPIDDHSRYVDILAYLTQRMREQLEDTDESVYYDDPLITGLSRGVPTNKELGQFLKDGNVSNINDAFYDLLAKTKEVQSLYISLKNHPILSEVKKNYCTRCLLKPVSLLKEYMDLLYLHGKLDDSEKETNRPQQNVRSTR